MITTNKPITNREVQSILDLQRFCSSFMLRLDAQLVPDPQSATTYVKRPSPPPFDRLRAFRTNCRVWRERTLSIIGLMINQIETLTSCLETWGNSRIGTHTQRRIGCKLQRSTFIRSDCALMDASCVRTLNGPVALCAQPFRRRFKQSRPRQFSSLRGVTTRQIRC